MGTFNRMADEIEELENILDSYYNIYTQTDISPKNIFLNIILGLRKLLTLKDIILANIIRNELAPELERLKSLPKISPSDLAESNYLLKTLYEKINTDKLYENKHYANSEQYYNNRILDLEKREHELRNVLEHNKSESQEHKKTSEEVRKKLSVIENELKNKKAELEFKQKQEDAKNDWELKIKSTFSHLKEYLSPIEKEHSRLNFLYYTYGVLSALIILLIITIEVLAIIKLYKPVQSITLEKYIMVFLPIPIAGALMWGFVFQMNRAQRQLLLLANNIHSIKYVQGLLISINNLSPNINDSVIRINQALDKIISIHLKNKSISNESELIKEEEKDNINIEQLLKIIKTVKETTK